MNGTDDSVHSWEMLVRVQCDNRGPQSAASRGSLALLCLCLLSAGEFPAGLCEVAARPSPVSDPRDLGTEPAPRRGVSSGNGQLMEEAES